MFDGTKTDRHSNKARASDGGRMTPAQSRQEASSEAAFGLGGAPASPGATEHAEPPSSTREMSLIASARFGDLLATTARRGILREQFDGLAMPEGFTHDEVWAALMSIRRSQAIHYHDVVYTQGEVIDSWFTPTYDLMGILRELELSTCAGSRLDLAFAERHSRRFIVRTLIEETVAALGCDGLEVDYETARALISGEQEPVDAVERLVVNTHALLSRIIDGDAERIAPKLVQEMFGALTEGIDTSLLGTHIPWGDEWPEDPIPPDEALRQICAMASGELGDPAEHPIILSQRLICKFWKTAPYPCCNYIMGSLLSRLHMKQAGYPVFAYVPSSSIALAWKHGNFTCEGVAAYHRSGNVTDRERDWTVYWESCARLILGEVKKLEELIFHLKAQDDALLARLADDHAFNHRQRDVLRRTILVPGASLRIDDHRKRYDLAYSTARQDLTTLVERGMLDMHYEGKAQVFTARRGMKGILARKYGMFRA